MSSVKRPKLIYFTSVDWFFCSHFLERAIAAKNCGYDVLVITNVDQHGDRIKNAGLRLIHLKIERRSLNPFTSVKNIYSITKIYLEEKPDIVHHIALKPILLGGVASLLSRQKGIVNAIVGMGYLYISQRLVVKIIRPLLGLSLKLLLNPSGSKVIFENSDDLTSFVAAKIVREADAVLIKGAGVNPENFKLGGQPHHPPVVALVARLLWDKGIAEFVNAARIIKNKGLICRFLIIGKADLDNHASIDEKTLSEWRAEGVVELPGYRDDIPKLLSEVDIACLPSYREGLPKSLLEAMAAGLPCVTTDVPGCREAVRNGDNGILVPPQNAESLSDALERLLLDEKLRIQMGQRGRARVVQEFSTEIVTRQTISLYQLILSNRT
ncbi:uncharacterized protein NMK_0849 [Novimethylophilus kurashikiensis]|uniref:Glycosyl transferase family 1 n=1 Tax=Novimethylophilus kurashikiensis TaxID=1825523 RepID=A0A2R5F8R4_9PROT|nr:glycosyltransferase family 4 protein [Novimethylophilus kurashikiensis]GBG13303.1 uncharacterized protein NMK_0849 [Novimethylophilus kurashikiensis]